MEKCIILRYGEISVRGKNRRMYEDVLEKNVKVMLSKHNVNAKIKRYKGRMIALTDSDAPFLKKVFGVISISSAYRVKREAKEINQALEKLGNPIPILKFADKGKEDMALIEKIVKGSSGKAFIEVYPDNAFVYSKKEKAAGGLPIGSEGRVIAIIENERDILAALLVMKRGCEIIPFLKNKIDIVLLREYGCDNEITTVLDAKDALAVITGKKEKFSIPKLNPLAGMSDEKIKEMLRHFHSYL